MDRLYSAVEGEWRLENPFRHAANRPILILTRYVSKGSFGRKSFPFPSKIGLVSARCGVPFLLPGKEKRPLWAVVGSNVTHVGAVVYVFYSREDWT